MFEGYIATGFGSCAKFHHKDTSNKVLKGTSYLKHLKGGHTRTSLASETGWPWVPMSQTRPCVECHEPIMYVYIYIHTYISEPGSRVKLPEANSRARLVRVWTP
jgi:hypothetical protein